jgi:hypothetical protein
LAAVVLALGLGLGILLSAGQGSGQTQSGRNLSSRVVTCAASTPTNVISHNVGRVSLSVINVGTTHVSVGQSVTLNPVTLHAGAVLSLTNYVGSLDCLGGASVQLQVLEETK